MPQPPEIDGPSTIPQVLVAKRRMPASHRGPGLLRFLEDAIYEHASLLLWFAAVMIFSAGIMHRWGEGQLLGGPFVYFWIGGGGLISIARSIGAWRTGKLSSFDGPFEPSLFEWFIALTGAALVLGPFARMFLMMAYVLLLRH